LPIRESGDTRRGDPQIVNRFRDEGRNLGLSSKAPETLIERAKSRESIYFRLERRLNAWAIALA